VKDQCSCGCCWAFAAVEQIESDAIRTLKWNINSPLSTAQACECTYTYDGCKGGWPATAYSYVQTAGGIERDVNYPYPYCGQNSNSGGGGSGGGGGGGNNNDNSGDDYYSYSSGDDYNNNGGGYYYNNDNNDDYSGYVYGVGASTNVTVGSSVCAAKSSDFVIKVVNYFSTASDEPSIAKHVQNTGPVQVTVDASTWSTYTGGIVSVCCRSRSSSGGC